MASFNLILMLLARNHSQLEQLNKNNVKTLLIMVMQETAIFKNICCKNIRNALLATNSLHIFITCP